MYVRFITVLFVSSTSILVEARYKLNKLILKHKKTVISQTAENTLWISFFNCILPSWFTIILAFYDIQIGERKA